MRFALFLQYITEEDCPCELQLRGVQLFSALNQQNTLHNCYKYPDPDKLSPGRESRLTKSTTLAKYSFNLSSDSDMKKVWIGNSRISGLD